jgi:hypothetical protein
LIGAVVHRIAETGEWPPDGRDAPSGWSLVRFFACHQYFPMNGAIPNPGIDRGADHEIGMFT